MYVLQQIRAAAEASPGKLALVFNGAPIGYSAFWRYIIACREALGRHLPREGVAIVWADSLLEGWILNLALGSLGLDTVAAPNREAITELADRATCVITVDGEAARKVPPIPGLIHLTIAPPSRQALDLASPLPPAPQIASPGRHLSMTSGTTGRFKLVVRTFGAEAGPVLDRLDRYSDLGPGFTPLGADTVMCAYDLGIWSGGGHIWPLFIWSLQGAVVFDQSGPLYRALQWPGLTHSVGTPYILTQLMATPEAELPHLPHLQLIIQSGAVSAPLARAVMARLTPKLLINVSSTEAGGWARSLITKEEDLRWYRIDAGRRVEVVDEAGVVLPPGQLGRVRVALRPDNARGYLGDEATTAQVFQDDWFYPGDLGVLGEDGRLAIHGRATDILSIKGEKYPAEPWERAIQDQLGCDGVCVLNGDWDGAGERLCVFIESPRDLPAADVAAALRATLSGFPEAQAYVLQSLPRTPTGKVRRIDLAQRLRDGAFTLGDQRRH